MQVREDLRNHRVEIQTYTLQETPLERYECTFYLTVKEGTMLRETGVDKISVCCPADKLGCIEIWTEPPISEDPKECYPKDGQSQIDALIEGLADLANANHNREGLLLRFIYPMIRSFSEAILTASRKFLIRYFARIVSAQSQ